MAASKDQYVLDQQVGYLLRLANQRHGIIFQNLALDGLTPTQFSTMNRLLEHGPCSQNHLGRLAGMDVATIKGVVDRLRHREFVKIESDPEDKRRLLVSLTAKGKTLAKNMQDVGLQITEETLEPLNNDERSALLSALQKIT